MRYLVMVVLLAVLAAADDSPAVRDEIPSTGRGQMIAAGALTGAGAGITLLGLFLYSKGQNTSPSGGNFIDLSGLGEMLAGVFLIGHGISVETASIPFWISGAVRKARFNAWRTEREAMGLIVEIPY